MQYKQELNKTVQWNTHDMSGGVPVFAFDTKQSFRPAPNDNIADQGGFSQVSDYQFNTLITALGQTNSQVALNSRNLVQMGKDMTIMGENDTYFGNAITRIDNAIKGIVMTIGTTNNAVATNSSNLVKMGNSIKEHSDSPHNQGGGSGGLFGLSTMALAATGLGAYLLLRKK